MPNKKITPLPFLLIVGFSLIVMLAVLVAQYHSQNGINQLRYGNTQALVTFKVDNWLDEVVNETYVMEEEGKRFISVGSTDHFNNLQQAIQHLDKENAAIRQLDLVEDSARKMVANLISLVQTKSSPYRLLQANATDTVKRNVLALISTDASRQLTDSIYVAALQIQILLGRNLENTIVKNQALSSRVLSFSWIMGFISITAIAILASVIIRRLLQNFKLIKALDRAKTAAEKASEIKEQFLANMSHEIRTPVNSVLGFTNLLEKTELKENQAQFVSLIKTSGKNLLGIINDILDLSKMEYGMVQLVKNPFQLKQLCYEMEMMFFHQLAEKKLLFNCTIDKKVPAVIIGDKERLNQILMNLVSNAIKFTEQGGITVKVSLLSQQQDKVRLQFSVNDTGIGIKEDKLLSIFERFEQAETGANRKYGGTGLGLSIVKNLVEIQGGSIIAKSSFGQGAEFVFDLAFDVADEDFYVEEKALTATDKRSAAFALPQGLQVLVAEDNKMNQRLLQYIFDSWNVDFRFAENGKECMEALKLRQYDVILMDIQMPEIDGYEATGIIRQQLKLNLPIIAMTANALPGEKEKCEKMGMNDYISKPISEQALQEVLVKNLPFGSDAESNASLIDLNYLNQTFGGNKPFIKKMVEEFFIQYPKEIAALKQAAKDRSITSVRSKSHHLKTTLSTVNKQSPLLAYLEELERVEDNIAGWQTVEHTLCILDKQEINSSITASI